MGKSNHIPTDFELLERIYVQYYPAFEAHTRESPARSAKNYVPIDVKSLASYFNTDPDIIFGRLYYHLDRKHGFKSDDGSSVPFFSMKVGDDRHAVHFPLLASVLAELRQERGKHLLATWLAIAALLISAISLVISIRA